MHSRRSQEVTPPPGSRGPVCLGVGVLLVALGACARPAPTEPASPPSAPDAAVAAAAAPPAEPARDASVAAADLEVRLTVRKPLRLAASRPTGALAITITHHGPTPVELIHPDVHGLRFIDTATGASHTVLHPCDCGFVLGLDPYPESRRLRLAPGASTELVLDAWDCGGGPFRLPPPGRYRVSWRLAAPTAPDGQGTQRLEERCQAVLRRDDVWQGAPVSNELELELSSHTRHTPGRRR